MNRDICPSCGTIRTSDICPRCGYNYNLMRCRECGKWYHVWNNRCPFCDKRKEQGSLSIIALILSIIPLFLPIIFFHLAITLLVISFSIAIIDIKRNDMTKSSIGSYIASVICPVFFFGCCFYVCFLIFIFYQSASALFLFA